MSRIRGTQNYENYVYEEDCSTANQATVIFIYICIAVLLSVDVLDGKDVILMPRLT